MFLSSKCGKTPKGFGPWGPFFWNLRYVTLFISIVTLTDVKPAEGSTSASLETVDLVLTGGTAKPVFNTTIAKNGDGTVNITFRF